MRDIVNLDINNCKLNIGCLNILRSEVPAYGYQRTHQVLLLYILEHHECSGYFSAALNFDFLAEKYCTKVELEQKAIRRLGLPKQYRDLYLEQATICGLHGYNEFLNWRRVIEISKWLDENIYQNADDADTNDDDVTYHFYDLALVFYINALLLLL
ncbi:uncharacterized protein Dwil_GK27012 [Drosophila willistoni]|uniref:Uncharacterized protein n=2 Tax=Drosophila willistoni TaxID=7260 RepID=A0A0Q9X363_DROWI|nr:uncharacterized protein Dwil_GK27012 [Drosophila willistoni]